MFVSGLSEPDLIMLDESRVTGFVSVCVRARVCVERCVTERMAMTDVSSFSLSH